MYKLNRSTLLAVIALSSMMACNSTTETQPNKQKLAKQQVENNKKQAANKKTKPKNKKSINNLLAYANPGFEKEIDPKVLITRQDKGQVSKAEFGIMKEAAKSGKQGLGITLEKGSMKLQYGIWRLRDQIDANKRYRFEIDVNLIEGHAVLFNQVGGSNWQRAAIKDQLGWQVVGTVLEGKHLKTGKPLAFHIDQIKGKQPRHSACRQRSFVCY
ncbi:hypothetical protein RS130_22730 [Paraglaciecola aquimarina]|uniref:Lipoprotein n=1 Tax=Paraglaciecola aquimarina TaxID=1235557 RepID=A0ABU3T238_9ALTE|nr:hypothetical protein [Paraglaciecola aquimarina]MDU0356329.1 hypothetical protein [Paraglaciecola aquimarina]